MKINEILKESMTLSQAEKIFGRFGVEKPLQYSPEQLKKLYIVLAKKNHPDHGGSSNCMQEINDAFKVLVKVKTGLISFFR